MGIPKAVLCLLMPAAFLLAPALAPADQKDPKRPGTKAQAEAFVYPGARKFEEDRTGPGIYQAKFTSADGAQKVAEWYRKKVGLLAREGIAFNQGYRPGIRISVLEDARQPGKQERSQGEKRPVAVTVLVRKTNDFTVIAVVSRAKDEKVTHVALTYVDNKSQ